MQPKHATNIKLVYNQNSGMQTEMWEKLKETILYIRSKGYRVDGIGWQGHIGLSLTTKALLNNTDPSVKKIIKINRLGTPKRFRVSCYRTRLFY